MKKILVLSTFLVSLFLITACKSTKVKDNTNPDTETAVEQTSEEENAESEKKNKKKEKKNKKNKKDKKNSENTNENSETEETSAEVTSDNKNKNYIGWINKTSKDVLFKSGNMQIKLKPSFGTFNISVKNDAGKVIPVLATGDEYTSSSISLKTAKKTYRLLADNRITPSASKKTDGVTLSYIVNNVAEVKLVFDCFSSEPEETNDMMKVTLSVKNIGDKKDEFTLKTIFDTVLGESDKNHFYSSEYTPIKSEVSYRTMQNQKWFVSKNDKAAMQFIFYGADTTPTDIVALANYSTFQKNTWEPDMSSYRAFDNILSYNNSAVGVLWPTVKLMPNETSKNVFYIAFATDGRRPNGNKYVFEPEEKTVKKAAEPKVEIEEVEEDEPELPRAKTVKIGKKNLSKEQLTPEYIQNLIDRITALENDISSVNEDELTQLNAELDAILDVLRQ